MLITHEINGAIPFAPTIKIIMKQEDKELLIKDLCARLPYKVKVSYYDNETERQECDIVDSMYEDTQGIGVGQWCLKMDKFKPYLFPMSSMTEEQRREFKSKFVTYHPYVTGGWYNIEFVNRFYAPIEVIDWLNKKHFDYRGLIEKGLAIDATDLGIY